MLNLILKSKKGNNVSAGELLNSLAETNKAGGLSIHYVDRKPMLQFKSNPKGALEVITASVIFPMLLSKFVIEKSEAYALASWLSENFNKVQETETEPTGYFVTVLDDIREILNIDPKQTKKELLAQLTSIEFLINK